MNRKLLPFGVLALVAFAAFVTCNPGADESAPSEPNELHPNSTGPDEQGESGSLIDTSSP